VIRPVLGIVLALVLVTFVVGRATGLIGDATSTGVATSGVPDRSGATDPSPTAEPPGAPGATEGAADQAADRDRDRRPDREKDRGKRDKPDRGRGDGAASWVDGSTRDDELRSRVEELLADGRAPSASFRVSTLNVLGAGHTGPRGSKPSYASGTTRIGWIAQLLRQLDIDVVGLQEYEPVQHDAFERLTGDSYGIYPGPALGRNAIRNSIAWDRSAWEAVSTHTIPIPYFRGNRVPMPYVLLKHLASGRQVWFINIHNPTSSAKRGDNERWRDLGTSLQIELMRRLHTQTGHPVILMGDFNEREEAFCAVTRRAPAVAANGGDAGPPCVPPSNLGIDWVFGTENIEFSNYQRLRGGLISRATDHPVIVTDAELRDAPAP
jgi:endonuclease/exonuclease/phosphatase family metal-dependent hydrolase